jgi:uncharacterized protein (TIGR00375 family)
MKFIADLHVHSRYSRATARNLDLEHLYIAAQLKGITVVATGDFTHPGWFSEIQEKLVPAESGLFRLADSLAAICDESVPLSCRRPVRFMLEAEISNIYKKDGKTRKNHNLVYVPDMQTAAAFAAGLDAIGNIQSDGRPILGLDVHHMLEMLLEISDQAFLIPAHIWTPWFSALGSKSGFDSLEACFEDLTSYIFAYETGLSSDPAMNWRVSTLDDLTAVSNSDAHSPMNLGREANWFNTELTYEAIKAAMMSGDSGHFLGTFEFYPEEGKYHLDGHRKCDICFEPSEIIHAAGICPVCGKALTLGVLHRVNELADRPEGRKPSKTHPFYSIIPLAEILSELLNVGPKSKTVQRHYHQLLATLGPEFDVLHMLPLNKIHFPALPLLGEAIKRMRQKKVHIVPGYDGSYGKISVFQPGELASLQKQKQLFETTSLRYSSKPKKKRRLFPKNSVETPDIPGISNSQVTDKPKETKPKKMSCDTSDEESDKAELKNDSLLKDLNSEQLKAVCHPAGPLMIVAGPGTGKTRTLTHRIAFLIQNKAVAPEHILALTFTQKAAREMRERLALLLHCKISALPFAGTFHAFCFTILKEQFQKTAEIRTDDSQVLSALTGYRIINDTEQNFFLSRAMQQVKQKKGSGGANIHQMKEWIGLAKQKLLHYEDNPENLLSQVSDQKIDFESFSEVYRVYQTFLIRHQLYDYEDLIFNGVKLLEEHPAIGPAYRQRYPYVLVDEYQDINYAQYRMIRALVPENSCLCVIGDPDQAIYGFRGSDVAYFKRFLTDYPTADVITLQRNYRSTETILQASHQVIHNHTRLPAHGRSSSKNDDSDRVSRIYSGIHGLDTIALIQAPTEKAEAVAIGKSIEQFMEGLEFHAADFGKVNISHDAKSYGFSDFAVLYRTRSQAHILSEVFQKAGIPFQVVCRNDIFDIPGIVELLSLLKIIENQASIIDMERVLNIKQSFRQNKISDAFMDLCFHEPLNFFEAYNNIRESVSLQGSSQDFSCLFSFMESLKEMQDAVQSMSVAEKLSYISQTPDLKTFFKDQPEQQKGLNQLLKLAYETSSTIDFISDITLKTDIDMYHPEAQKVTLMTIHASKGLEFPVVFIAGCEKGFLPMVHASAKILDIDEERRLFYVAMTRAKEVLCLTNASKRIIFGEKTDRSPSPFLKDIEYWLKVSRVFIQDRNSHKRKSTEKQLELF